MSVLVWHEAISAFIVHLSAAGRAARTRKLRRWQLNCFAEHAGVGPTSVTLPMIESWLDRPDWSNNTRATMKAGVVSFFTWLHVTGQRPDNPAARLAPVHITNGSPRPCPESILRAALAAGTERQKLMIALAAEAGFRRAEIATARREDLEDGIGGACMRIVGKGDRVRVVPILDNLAEMIRGCPDGWLFPSPWPSGHLTPDHVGRLVSELLPEGWSTHSLRHRFASAAYAVDQDLRAVQELLGHASVETTQIYTALPNGAKRRAALGASVLLRDEAA